MNKRITLPKTITFLGKISERLISLLSLSSLSSINSSEKAPSALQV
jgi:hypothetical protein